jgi:hypothetical protein
MCRLVAAAVLVTAVLATWHDREAPVDSERQGEGVGRPDQHER